MSKEYYCEEYSLCVGEALVAIEVIHGKPTYVNFHLPEEPCQVYHETEVREIE